MNKDRVLVCKNIKFYFQKDREAFFEWIKKLEFIENVIEHKTYIELDLVCNDLCADNLYDLIALFRRYKIDMRQLQKLVGPSSRRDIMNRSSFCWKPIFGEKGPIIKNGLVLGPLNFFSPEDKEVFLDWVQAVRQLESYHIKKDALYANLYSTPITLEDLKNLIGIFKRYNLDRPEQLKERFGIPENQAWFQDLSGEKNNE